MWITRMTCKRGKPDSSGITMACGSPRADYPILGNGNELEYGSPITRPHPIMSSDFRVLAPTLAKTHALRKVGAGRRVVWRYHGIVVREAPLLTILFGRQIVVRAQVPLQRLELLPVLETDNVLGRDGLLDRNRGLQLFPGGQAGRARGFAQRVEHIVDDTRKVCSDDRVVADIS